MPPNPSREPASELPDRHAARRLGGRLAAVTLGVAVLLGIVPSGAPAAAADPIMPPDGLTVTGQILVDGHVRLGSWFAIAMDLENNGPAITGELRIAGGSASRTRFSTPVELATGSRKRYLLYAQPPSFGGNVQVDLVDSSGTIIAETPVTVTLHDQSQLVVGVVSENPARIVGQLDLLPSATGAQTIVAALTPAELPERLEAWAVLDRLVWQDVDTTQLTPGQQKALRGWIAGGGRLVIIGGTAAPDALAGFPDEILPYRPTSTLDVDPEALRGVLGGLPDRAADLAVLAGDAGRGRTIATSGDRIIAADLLFGSGSVTLLGFDPTTSWIAEGDTHDAPLWRRYLPARSGSTVGLTDDSTILSAVSNLPALALPPIGALVVLLVGYIVLVGPVNYLVLRQLDRREWAWVTVPVLIAVFSVGSFGIGAAVRGSDLIIHEVAIVRGATGTPDAMAQVYFGVFSPSRDTYQLRAPGGALLASPINGDIFGSDIAGPLDVLQGDPSRIRDLAVGFGSLRAVRADSAASGPVVDADLRLEGSRLRGTVTNRSESPLLGPAIVLGSSSVNLADIPAGGTAQVELALAANPFTQATLSERVVGNVFFDGNGTFDEAQQRRIVRRSILDQLSWDPTSGMQTQLATDAPMLLAWGVNPVVGIEIEGEKARRVSNVLYTVPLALRITGETTFRSDLLRAAVLEVDANFFTRDPWTMSFGPGTLRMSYRPLAFDGTFSASKVVVALNSGGDPGQVVGAKVLQPAERCDPALDDGCEMIPDGLPELDVLDRSTGEWVEFPHMGSGAAYQLPNAKRWIDPATGDLQVRFVNARQDSVGFQFHVELTGDVE